ncbi:hypothetical protein GGR54DRAFT_638750 [Hypoxylon sp. NC1633]|nr:hypothetical protein GGR54DRAFT_638750 [Hypoxylon sp. NC1633]
MGLVRFSSAIISSSLINNYMDTINGEPSLMSMRGTVWKKWRGIFNPGFAADYIGGLAQAIAEEAVVFCKLLEALAKKELFQLEENTLRLTFDVITRYNPQPVQDSQSPTASPEIQQLSQYLNDEIDKRYQKLDVRRKGGFAEPQAWSRSVISLAMDQYLEGEGNDHRGEL